MSPEQPAPPRFFLDRGLGSRVVPDGLRAQGWIVTTMDERYGKAASQSVQDVDWITDATAAGESLLCKDAAIARVAAEAQAVYTNDARLFALSDARLTGPEMLDTWLANQEAVFTWARTTPPPFVVSVGRDGLRRRRLNYP